MACRQPRLDRSWSTAQPPTTRIIEGIDAVAVEFASKPV